MPIRKRSRYRRSPIYAVSQTRSGRRERKIFTAPILEQQVRADDIFSISFFSEDDALDISALDMTGDHQDWWVIADISGIRDIFALQEGDQIIIPPTTVFLESS